MMSAEIPGQMFRNGIGPLALENPRLPGLP